ncbi:MAG: translation initiation factor IF-2 [Bacteroidetes bacterium]|nr:translation initiation factor IF-2 [Bacteroidota bacterium]
MAVTEKKSKIRLYKVAKEYNISHDNLTEFLKKKGFEVKNHMSVLDESMLELIEKHYKKEKTDAERHARKRKEFDELDRKRRGDEFGDEEEDTPAKATQPEPASVKPADVSPETEISPVEQKTEEADISDAPETTVEAGVEDSSGEREAITEKEGAVADVEAEKEIQVTTEETAPGDETTGTEAVDEAAVAPEPPPVDVPPATRESKKAKASEEPAASKKEKEQPVEAREKEEDVVGKAPVPATDTTPETAEDVPSEKKEDIPAAKKEAAPESKKPRRKEADAEGQEVRKKAKKDEVDLSIESSMPKMRGLTVKGKINLQEAVPPEKGKKEEGTAAGTTETEAQRRKKKKKKKVIRTGTTPEETAESEARKKRGKKGRPREVDQAEVASAIKKTIASMSDLGPVSQRSAVRKRKRARREEEQQREIQQQEQDKQLLRIYEYATVSDLAGYMNVGVNEVIASLINLGVMASINQRLDMETIELVASEFGFEVQQHEEYADDDLADTEDAEETLRTRPPIVTIMGHVDHGKTKLLDFIRKTNVVAGESGGITQHIGAYTVTLENKRKISFLDTPGHEAFTAMRARGAQVTDIVVLVVAADDSVMPQTVEAISHAQAARVPIIVALNKIDRPDSNPDKIKQQLADRGLLVEEWGGKYGCVHISAKEGINIEELLERIVLEADILELKANPDRGARGAVIESELDKGKGIVATVLVQKGTLQVGDAFVAGNEFGRVRALLDERGNRVEDATPATPVQVLGFNGAPQAGDTFVVVTGERTARDVAINRQQIKRESDFRRVHRKTLDDISEQIKLGGVQDLHIVVKGDVDGSVEALSDSLLKLSTEEVRIDVIHKSVGAISESDVLLASASEAIIIGFRVRPNLNARKLAETEAVDIRMYEIIYDAIEDVRSALEGMLRPDIQERITATVEVRDVFKISKVGTIAGCFVQDGKITRNSRVRLLRDGIVVFTGGIDSLKRFKDDVREVDSGFECGLNLLGFNDIKEGDVIEAFEQVEVKRSLDQKK